MILKARLKLPQTSFFYFNSNNSHRNAIITHKYQHKNVTNSNSNSNISTLPPHISEQHLKKRLPLRPNHPPRRTPDRHSNPRPRLQTRHHKPSPLLSHLPLLLTPRPHRPLFPHRPANRPRKIPTSTRPRIPMRNQSMRRLSIPRRKLHSTHRNRAQRRHPKIYFIRFNHKGQKRVRTVVSAQKSGLKCE